MPLISTFYGILIYMYWNDNKQHHRPHIHAQYAGDEGIFDIERLAGRLLASSPTTPRASLDRNLS